MTVGELSVSAVCGGKYEKLSKVLDVLVIYSLATLQCMVAFASGQDL